MDACVPEKGSNCTHDPTLLLEALEGGMKQKKCQNCMNTLQRRMGSTFEIFYRASRIERGNPAARMLCND